MSTQTTEPASSWRRAILDAKRAALAALTPDERAEAAAGSQAAALKREAKRKQRVEISAMVIAGQTPAEISAATGLSLSALWRRRMYWGLPIAARRGSRRLPAWIPDAHVAELDELARDMGIDRGRAVEALLRAMLMDGAAVARRSLGVRRRAAA